MCVWAEGIQVSSNKFGVKLLEYPFLVIWLSPVLNASSSSSCVLYFTLIEFLLLLMYI